MVSISIHLTGCIKNTLETRYNPCMLPEQQILPLAQWRLIRSQPAPGAWNMAVDEAVLESVGHNDSLPTLRLYQWSPPCLSLGYSQPAADVDRQALQENGWELVRRPTGGRAILHTDELTYSVIAPIYEPRLAGSLLESYRRLAQALLLALRSLGLPARADDIYPQVENTQENQPVCFERPSNYEITVEGKKLVGSAQARRPDGVLQHGSLPLTGDLTRITRALWFPSEQARQAACTRLLARAATVESILNRQVPWEEAASMFENAFARTLNLHFIPGDLTDEEQARAKELVAGKYASAAWTEKT